MKKSFGKSFGKTLLDEPVPNKKSFGKSFGKTLLDEPVPNKKVKFSLRGNKPKLETNKLLPDPIKPTKLTPKPIPKPRKNLPKPVPKPRILSKRPVPLPRLGLLPRRIPVPLPRRGSLPRRPMPRRRPKSKRPVLLPKPIDLKVKKLIDEITPYYKPEAIREFQNILRDKKSRKKLVKEKSNALRGHAKSFEVNIIEKKDPLMQLYYTTNDM